MKLHKRAGRQLKLGENSHYLKHPSSFIVVVLRSLAHQACVNCGKPVSTLDESAKHWLEELGLDERG